MEGWGSRDPPRNQNIAEDNWRYLKANILSEGNRKSKKYLVKIVIKATSYTDFTQKISTIFKRIFKSIFIFRQNALSFARGFLCFHFLIEYIHLILLFLNSFTNSSRFSSKSSRTCIPLDSL